MNVVKYTSQEDVKNLFDELIDKAKKGEQIQRLTQINDVCSKLFKQGSEPSVAAIVKILGNKGIQISTRTIYNKRKGTNPYPILIDAWIELAQSKKMGFSPSVESKHVSFTEHDLSGITDPVFQHKMKIILGQYESLKKQNVALREIQNLPLISPNMEAVNSSAPRLGVYEIEIISHFLNKLHPSLSFDEDGALIAKKPIKSGVYLSDPGLREALLDALGDSSLLNE